MQCRVLTVALVLLGITCGISNAGAQSCDVDDSSIGCAPQEQYPESYYIQWQGTPSSIPWGKVVAGAYSPVYGPFSPPTYYVATSDVGGAKVATVFVPQNDIDWSDWPNYSQLDGAYVWFEYGTWSNNVWNRDGYLCDPCWVTCPGGSCFAAGTPLLTPENSKPIEQFKTGDWILAAPQNDSNAPPVARRVKEVLSRPAKLVVVKVGDRAIRTTREHPFYVNGKGWVPAASLRAGDLLRSHNDRPRSCSQLLRAASRQFTTYSWKRMTLILLASAIGNFRCGCTALASKGNRRSNRFLCRSPGTRAFEMGHPYLRRLLSRPLAEDGLAWTGGCCWARHPA